MSVRAEDHIGLVRSVVRRHAAQAARLGVDLQDLNQEGALALLRAAQTFDETRGIQFSTYGGCTVEWTVRTYLKRQRTLPGLVAGRYPSGEDFFGAVADRAYVEAGTAVRDQVERLLARLRPRERFVVSRSFGLGGRPALTSRELARILGRSRQRVQQILAEALERLRRYTGLA